MNPRANSEEFCETRTNDEKHANMIAMKYITGSSINIVHQDRPAQHPYLLNVPVQVRRYATVCFSQTVHACIV
jgi:hypothetical protein